jgi:hypothetical protein
MKIFEILCHFIKFPVRFNWTLAASGGALMKLHGMTIDGWWMSLRSVFFKQTEYINSTFDVGRSMFNVHQFISRLDWPLFRPTAGLNL